MSPNARVPVFNAGHFREADSWHGLAPDSTPVRPETISERPRTGLNLQAAVSGTTANMVAVMHPGSICP